MLDTSVFLDVPIARQIIGFVFITVLPGFLIIEILKLDKIDLMERLILSVGISIAFITFLGLSMNFILPNIGYVNPLSLKLFMISFNIAVIIMTIVGCKYRYLDLKLPISLNRHEKMFLIVAIYFPVLSILGTYLMNSDNNNTILISLLVSIPIYVFFVCIYNNKLRIYPIMIFLISLSLLLLYSLRSYHLIGIDTHSEYYFFQETLKNMRWNIFGDSILSSTLSISILPTLYQTVTNIDSEFLFKILYPSIYSISPLIIYIISKKYISDFYSFLASCFFMFQYNFLFTTMNARTSVAILYFALVILVIFSDRINIKNKRTLFIVFLASLVVSHYSTTYISFFIFVSMFIITMLFNKKVKILRLEMLVVFFIMIFFWYSQITDTAFDFMIYFIQDMFSNEMKGGGVPILLGKGILEKNMVQKIDFISTWLTFFAICVGMILSIKNYKKMCLPDFDIYDFLKKKFDVEYFVIAIICSGMLVLMLLLPFVSIGYDIQRLYQVMLVVLPIFFIIGCMTLSRLFKVRTYFVVLIIMTPYFLGISGVSYQLFGIPRSIILNSSGDLYDMLYIHDHEYYGVKWLNRHADNNVIINADFYGIFRFISQGFSSKYLNSYDFSSRKEVKGYMFLRYFNIVNRRSISMDESKNTYVYYDMNKYLDMLIHKDLIYNNSGSEIYLNKNGG